jgi:hypothetical protein
MGQPPIFNGKILLIIKDELSTKSCLDIFFCAVSREAASSEIKGDISLPTLLFFWVDLSRCHRFLRRVK